MYCPNCGNELKDGAMFCGKCGMSVKAGTNGQNVFKNQDNSQKCLPAFILGLIGSIFGILGGFCTTMCLSSFGSSSGDAAFILILGGAIVGLVGACKCLTKVKTGSILELISAVMMIICAYGTGAEFMTVLAFVLMLIGGIIGAFQAFVMKKK